MTPQERAYYGDEDENYPLPPHLKMFSRKHSEDEDEPEEDFFADILDEEIEDEQ